MSKLSYFEKLQDPRWQKKRLEILEYAEWRCQICGRNDMQLHVHHSYYLKGRDPWNYLNGSMISVCHVCHGILHPEKIKKAEKKPEPQREFTEEEKFMREELSVEDGLAYFAKLREEIANEK